MKVVQPLVALATKSSTPEGAVQKLTDDLRTSRDALSHPGTCTRQKAYELLALQLQPDDSRIEKD
jgi:hypothetical protein